MKPRLDLIRGKEEMYGSVTPLKPDGYWAIFYAIPIGSDCR